DYAVFNFDLSLSSGLGDGRNASFVQKLPDGDAEAFFLTDHGTNSSNTVLLLCGEQIGMNASNFGDQMAMQVLAVDWYNSGLVTDVVGGLTIAPLGERYFGIFGSGDFGSTDIAPGASTTMSVVDFGAAGTNPTEQGLLLVNDASRFGWRGGAPLKKEALLIRVGSGGDDGEH
ncbi:MAG: hypothetical protein M3R57_03470, partial [Chloroflexota bacterium]|nr:hypothetical protein [Chloroflexota bacterium]